MSYVTNNKTYRVSADTFLEIAQLRSVNIIDTARLWPHNKYILETINKDTHLTANRRVGLVYLQIKKSIRSCRVITPRYWL